MARKRPTPPRSSSCGRKNDPRTETSRCRSGATTRRLQSSPHLHRKPPSKTALTPPSGFRSIRHPRKKRSANSKAETKRLEAERDSILKKAAAFFASQTGLIFAWIEEHADTSTPSRSSATLWVCVAARATTPGENAPPASPSVGVRNRPRVEGRSCSREGTLRRVRECTRSWSSEATVAARTSSPGSVREAGIAAKTGRTFRHDGLQPRVAGGGECPGSQLEPGQPESIVGDGRHVHQATGEGWLYLAAVEDLFESDGGRLEYVRGGRRVVWSWRVGNGVVSSGDRSEDLLAPRIAAARMPVTTTRGVFVRSGLFAA